MGGRLLAVTGGHRVDLEAFAAMLDAVCEELGWSWNHATQPAAQRWLRPEHAGVWDAIVLHDIPGLALDRGVEPRATHPSEATRAGIRGLLAAGQGLVVTHHALAGWPTWDGWAHIVGGRFCYAPGTLDGVEVPASGYRFGRYRVEPADPAHPVCAGVEPFEVSDEQYLCPVFTDEVTSLLRSGAPPPVDDFIDTHREVVDGEQVPAVAQAGSDLLGWSRVEGPSRLVYLLPGHGPSTMEHPMYRRLLANACAWVAPSRDHGPFAAPRSTF